jgi:hypothetical protein
MNVLVIPEDFRKDQFILKPIIRALIADSGRRGAKIEICMDPLLGGIAQALDLERIREIVEFYPMIDLFLLCVDRDGEANRRVSLDRLEQEISPTLKPHQSFLAENAWQELEVWVLAGHDLPNEWQWAAIRQERDPKERYFAPLAKSRGLENTPGDGRKILAEEASRRFARIRQLCREDIEILVQRVSTA